MAAAAVDAVVVCSVNCNILLYAFNMRVLNVLTCTAYRSRCQQRALINVMSAFTDSLGLLKDSLVLLVTYN